MNKKALVPALGITMLAGIISTPSVFAENKTTGVSLDVEEKMTLTLDKHALDFTAMDSSLQIDNLRLSVLTNAANGYTVSFSANNDYNDLKHSNAAITEKIPSVTEQKTADTFTETAWAYSLDTENHTFNQIPIVPQNIFTAKTKGQNAYDFSIGVRVKDALAAGDYSNELIFTAIANPTPIAFSNIRTMQQMTPEVCAAASENETNQLQDIRDGKYYWVTKLADGNCWMTQNLDYDLSTTTTLTPTDSDVTANWTPSRATIAGAANLNTTNWANNNNNPYSFDPGNYYFDGTYFSSATCNYLTTTCDHFATTPYDLNGEHGHVGNYYNWSAAVASNDTSATTAAGTDINTSICPKGWRLPHGYQSAQGNDFATLNTTYGGATNSDSVLLANPLFFVRGGGVNSGSLLLSASLGYYWSSTAYSAAVADDFYFDSGSVYTSDSYFRSGGFSVRCLAHKQTQTLTIKDQSDDSVIATYDFETTYKLPEVQKEGYNLLGYAEDKTATEPTYNVGDTITEEKTLYAIYEDTYLHMQNVASWKDTLELGQQIQVRDTRDNKIYWVSKLKDGNIWMTQNLDYDLSVQANQTLTPATSNVTTTRTVTPVSWGMDYNSIYYLDGGDNYFVNGITQTAGLSSLPTDDTNRHYAQGDYYSWKAATAGVGTTDITNADVNESICPSGWRLPTSNSNSANYSFGNLVKQYGYTGSNQSGTTDATLLASPLFFAHGGDVSSGSLYNQGSRGYYWSSRAYSSSHLAYLLYLYSSNVYPSDDLGRYLGCSVRCVAL